MFTWSEMPDPLPTPAHRRWVMFVVPCLVAAIVYYLGQHVAAVVLLAVGITVGIGTQISVGFARTFERTAAFLSFSLGAGLRWVLLAPFYLLLMTPMALFNRLSAHDPLQLRLDKTKETYWSTPPKSGGYDRPY